MSDRANLQQELEIFLRVNGVAVQGLNVVLNELRSPYRQFSLQMDESMLRDFVTLFKRLRTLLSSPMRRKCRPKSLRNLTPRNG